jgi:hypothetical protein
MVDQRVAAEKQNGVYTCMLPEHEPVRHGREMIELLAVEEPKPKPAKLRALSYEAAPVVRTHAVVSFGPNPASGQ